jgi:hypothetical protein
LDVYSDRDLDDRQFSELSLGEQLMVNAELDARDRARIRREGRVPAAFLGGTLFVTFQVVTFLDERDDVAMLPRRRRHMQQQPWIQGDDEEVDDEGMVIRLVSSLRSCLC